VRGRGRKRRKEEREEGVEKRGGEYDVWVPNFGSWDSVEIWRMMSAGEENMEERIRLSWQEYSVLEEKMEYNECG
jgi:hypothetical protein